MRQIGAGACGTAQHRIAHEAFDQDQHGQYPRTGAAPWLPYRAPYAQPAMPCTNVQGPTIAVGGSLILQRHALPLHDALEGLLHRAHVQDVHADGQVTLDEVVLQVPQGA